MNKCKFCIKKCGTSWCPANEEREDEDTNTNDDTDRVRIDPPTEK
jgi:hypothetical protein